MNNEFLKKMLKEKIEKIKLYIVEKEHWDSLNQEALMKLEEAKQSLKNHEAVLLDINNPWN